MHKAEDPGEVEDEEPEQGEVEEELPEDRKDGIKGGEASSQ